MSDAKPNRAGLIIIIAAALLFVLLMLCTFQVRTTQVAMVSTMGQLNEMVYGPGLHGKFPWPFQKAILLDKTLQVFESTYEENYTADEKTLIMTIFATWEIDNPTSYAGRKMSKDTANQILSDVIRTEKGVVISSHPVSHLISIDTKVRKFETVEKEIFDRVDQALVKKDCGMKLKSLGIEQISLSPQITKDVFERMAGERRNKAEKIRQEGVLKAGQIRAQAHIERGRIEAEANETAKKIQNEGDLAAAEQYVVFEQDREFAIFLRELESLERLMSKKTTLILDRDMPPFSLLKGEFLQKAAEDEKKQLRLPQK